MDNDIETESKTRHSTSATEPGEVDEIERMRLNLEKHRATQFNQEEESNLLEMLNSE